MLKEIELSDRELIEKIRKKYGHTHSSHAFNTLYIWRNIIGKQLYIEDDVYSLRYTAKGENSWIFPCGSDDEKYNFIISHLGQSDFRLCYMRAEDELFLLENFKDKFTILDNRDDFEYLYERKKHIDLAGKDYKIFRKKVSHVEHLHDIRIEEIDDSNLEIVVELILSWEGNEGGSGVLKTYGNEMDIEPLRLRKELGYQGILMYVDGKAYGTAIGFSLSDNEWDFAICKSAYKDKDLGYYLHRAFIETRDGNCTYINMEDDLGLEGLRTFKTALKPDKFYQVSEAFIK